MASEVEIWNLALAHIGDRANVSSTTENSVQADRCRMFYPMARDRILSEHSWTFATTRIALAQLTLDVDSWDYKYQLPTDSLKFLAVLEDEAEDDHPSWPHHIEGDAIYTDVEQATGRYIRKVPIPGELPVLVYTALSHLLASLLAGPIIKGREGRLTAEGQMKLYYLALGIAKAQDANQTQAEPLYVPGGLRVREQGVDVHERFLNDDQQRRRLPNT